LGATRQRDGDHHALAHAATELVRVGVDAPLGIRNLNQRNASIAATLPHRRSKADADEYLR
jgi:hypothetical protein